MSLIRFALHGGAGVIDREQFSAERESAYRTELHRIAEGAVALLKTGATALDAVQWAVAELESCPFFNAGYGAVLNRDGVVELDASIMEGRDRRAGAVGGVSRITHPIAAARALLDDGQHVLLAGPNADRWAAAQGLPCQDPPAFVIPERVEQLRLAQAEGRVSLDHDERYGVIGSVPLDPKDKTGTVGAVARDAHGHLAAATSTGGMTNKVPGRLGDSPVIGAGTWADDDSCCVSATGHGEFFLRTVLAYDIHARMVYGAQPLEAAAQAVLDRIEAMGGSGGLIAIDRHGHITLPFNSPGMYRASYMPSTGVRVGIYRDDEA